jgi:PAS domain S-box-containing protein
LIWINIRPIGVLVHQAGALPRIEGQVARGKKAGHSSSMSKASQAVAKSEVMLFPQPALQLIYDTAPIGLACLSPDCRYLRINRRLTEICGISVEDHLGRSVRDCVPALADSVEQIVRSIVETGEPVTGIEVAGQRPDQSEERSWVTYWHPLRTPSGEVVAVNVAAEEITARKRSEQEMRRAREAAETTLQHLRETQASLIEAEKLAALGRLVAGVAHEINGPVGSSLTVASSLQRRYEIFAGEVERGDIRRSALNEFLGGVRDAAVQLVANLVRASELVQSFKQVAADRSGLERRRFDVGELAEQVLVGLRPEVRKQGLVLDITCEPDLVIDSLPGPCGLVVSNLVLNSIMHAFPDGGKGTITLRAGAFGESEIEVVVSDNGCGMSPQIRRHAFDPFFSTRRHEGATGLGLHIVHSMVLDRLQGWLALTSEPGAGTSVRLILPRTISLEPEFATAKA